MITDLVPYKNDFVDKYINMPEMHVLEGRVGKFYLTIELYNIIESWNHEKFAVAEDKKGYLENLIRIYSKDVDIENQHGETTPTANFLRAIGATAELDSPDMYRTGYLHFKHGENQPVQEVYKKMYDNLSKEIQERKNVPEIRFDEMGNYHACTPGEYIKSFQLKTLFEYCKGYAMAKYVRWLESELKTTNRHEETATPIDTHSITPNRNLLAYNNSLDFINPPIINTVDHKTINNHKTLDFPNSILPALLEAEAEAKVRNRNVLNNDGVIHREDNLTLKTLRTNLTEPQLKKLHTKLNNNYMKKISENDFIYLLSGQKLVGNSKMNWKKSRSMLVDLLDKICLNFLFPTANNCFTLIGNRPLDSNDRNNTTSFPEIIKILEEIKK